MVVSGDDIQFQLDGGATVNVLPVREYKKVSGDPELKELKASEAILSMYNGSEIHSPFSSTEFHEFAQTYELQNFTSSPMYPQSNGKVENAVRVTQNIMKACLAGTDLNLSLLDY